jgi:ATP-dependent DNA ligase
VQLPVNPPILPMLSKRIATLPEGEGWIFEPKWDGFRALIFRDHDELMIQSRDEKPLNRFFPELAAPLLAQLPKRCALDGEIVIARNGGLDFDALQLRLHPAASRVKLLSLRADSSLRRPFRCALQGRHGLESRAFSQAARNTGRYASIGCSPASRHSSHR